LDLDAKSFFLASQEFVGPEPSGTDNGSKQRRVNIEALLLMAKYDKDFYQKLLEDRNQALIDSGIDFSKGEKNLLLNIEKDKLKKYIKNFEIKGITKNSLKSWARAASVVLFLSSFFLKCGNDSESENPVSDGHTPDDSYSEYIKEK
jgi:hypothetical protein